MTKIKLLSLLTSGIIFTSLASGTRAVNTQPFASCTNPTGTIKADYSSGIHGIVGSTAEYRGRDTVYQISADRVLQCFCPTSGEAGIQTNWWKIPNLTDSEIEVFKSQGWVFIPNGALWGLDEAPYLAINSNHNCGSLNGDSASSAPSSVQGAVAAAVNKAGEVLGLANTGNDSLFYSLFAGGTISLIIGLVLHKRTSK